MIHEYCTKLKNKHEYEKIVRIAGACGLKVYWMNEKTFANYLQINTDDRFGWDLDSSNIGSGKVLSNIDFVSALYEYSCLKENS